MRHLVEIYSKRSILPWSKALDCHPPGWYSFPCLWAYSRVGSIFFFLLFLLSSHNKSIRPVCKSDIFNQQTNCNF